MHPVQNTNEAETPQYRPRWENNRAPCWRLQHTDTTNKSVGVNGIRKFIFTTDNGIAKWHAIYLVTVAIVYIGIWFFQYLPHGWNISEMFRLFVISVVNRLMMPHHSMGEHFGNFSDGFIDMLAQEDLDL